MLVTVGDGEKDNLFPVTWNMPVRKEPPMVAMLSGKRHYSYPFIEKTGEFGLNIVTAEHAGALLACGLISGHKEPNKFEKYGLTRLAAETIKAPLVEQAVATAECRVAQVVDLGPSALLVAQILRASADPDCFADGAWKFDDGLELIHHLGGNKFAVSDRVIVGKIPS